MNHGTKADDKYRDMYIGIKDFIPLPFNDVPVFSDDEENRFQTLARLLHSTLHRKEPNYKQTAQAIFYSMYQILAGWSIQEPKNSIIDYAISEIVSKLCESELFQPPY